MIIKEQVIINGRTFNKTYSDTYMIRKVGTNEVYSEAIDQIDKTYVYEETDMLLQVEEEEIKEV